MQCEDVVLDVMNKRVFEKDQQSHIPHYLALTVSDEAFIRKFLTTPLPQDVLLQTIIRRHKSGFLGRYAMFELRGKDTGLLLLCAKPQAKTSANYHISRDKQCFDAHYDGYMGKLRGVRFSSDYTIYDAGVAPRDAGGRNRGDRPIRQEIGAVMYTAQYPKLMTVLLSEPSVCLANGVASEFREGRSVGHIFRQKVRSAWRDKDWKGFSSKNFILVEESQTREKCGLVATTERMVLLFGKIKEDHYSMKCRGPLSPLQAFAICLSTFHERLR